MITTYIDSFGSSFGLLFEGSDREELNLFYYQHWLWGVFQDINPHENSENSIWGWSNPERYIKSIKNWELNKLHFKYKIDFEGETLDKKLIEKAKNQLSFLKQNFAKQFIYTNNKSVIEPKCKYNVMDWNSKIPKVSDDLLTF